MRFNARRLTLLAIAVLTVAGLETPRARGDEKKTEARPDTSEQKSSVPPTNSPSFKPKQNGLKQLEQDLFRPFETIAPQGSLDGAFVPPMPETRPATSSVQNKRKELMERRRDWVFETPEEILAGPSTDDLINGRDNEKKSDDKSNLSPLERFYERLYNKDKKEITRKGKKRDDLYDSQKPTTPSDKTDTDDDSDLPFSVRETQREMRKLFAPKERKGDSTAEPGRNSFSDVFGLGKTTRSREEIEIQRERMDRYKDLLGLPLTPKFENDPLKQFRDIVGTSPRNAFVSTMDSSGSLPQQSLFGSQPATAIGAPNTSFLPEGAQVHTTPSLAPVLPKLEPPKSLPPPVTFSVPRRQF